MALHERIKAEFKDLKGRDYTIRFYKEEVISGGSRSFTVGGEGFTHEYFTDSEEIWSFIKYGKIEVPLIIQNATDKTVTDELIEGNEGDWFIKITHTSDSIIYFQGIVLIDQSFYDNISYPYILRIYASDGLSLLQNKQMDSSFNFFDVPLSQWFFIILNQFSFDDFGTFKLWSSFRMWNGQMLEYDNSDEDRDPLTLMFLEQDNFTFVDNDSGRNYETFGEVLNQLCNFLHCELIYANGTYWLINLYEKQESTLYLSKYTGAFTLDPTNPNTYDSGSGYGNDNAYDHRLTINTGREVTQLGIFKTKPAAKLVREPNKYQQELLEATVARKVYTFDPKDAGTTGNLNVPDTRLKRIIQIRNGINSVTLKGKVKWNATAFVPTNSSAYGVSIAWEVRYFFTVTSNSSFEVDYNNEVVYDGGASDTWAAGVSRFVDTQHGFLRGENRQRNVVPSAINPTTLKFALTSASVTQVFVNGDLGTIDNTGWIQVTNNNLVVKTLHYSAYSKTLRVFTIDTTGADADFSVVNASIGNAVRVLAENYSIYEDDFEITVRNFPNTGHLRFNVAVEGQDMAGNVIAFPEERYEYETVPSTALYYTDSYLLDFEAVTNKGDKGDTTFEFVTQNSGNSSSSYEIILPDNKILEKEIDTFGNDTNWLKVFSPDETTGEIDPDEIEIAGKLWSEGISGSKTNFLRYLNHTRLLRLTNKPYLVLETILESYFSPHQTIEYDTKDWIFNSGIFTANLASWELVLIQINSNSTTSVVDDVINARVSFQGNNGNVISRYASDISKFDYLALTDGETSGTVTTIQIRDGKGVKINDNQEVKIYNPANGDYETIVVNGEWDGENDLTVDSIALSNVYPDGSLIQVTGSDTLQIINNNELKSGLIAFKTADETINLDTTLSNDTDLQLELDINSLYILEGQIFVDSDPTADFKFAFSIPSGATLILVKDQDGNPSTTFSTANQTFATAGGVVQAVQLKGIVETAGTGGNLIFRWAQNINVVDNTTLKKGSYLIAKKII